MLGTYFWINFALNLLATFVIYSGPILIYRLIKKEPIEEKAAKKICLIYGVFSFFLMSCIILALSGEGAASATIIIYYWINKWILTHKKKEVVLSSSKELPGEWYTCEKCGHRVAWGEKCVCSSNHDQEPTSVSTESFPNEDNEILSEQIEESPTLLSTDFSPEEQKTSDPLAPPRKKPGTVSRIVAVVSSVLCVVLLIGGAFLWSAYRDVQDEIAGLEATTEKYEKQIESLKETRAKYIYQVQEMEQFNKYSSRIGFMVSDDDYLYYHKYDCDTVKNADYYQCHNIEFCEWLGAESCPKCHKSIREQLEEIKNSK